MLNDKTWWSKRPLGMQLFLGALAATAFWLAWAVLGVRTVHWAWTGCWVPFFGADEKTMQQLGQVGDLFGGINALFAAFAFVGVAIAAYYQHQTFMLQVAQQAIVDKQYRQNVRQVFEVLFFKMLDGAQPPTTLKRGSAGTLYDEPFSEVVGRLRDRFDTLLIDVRRNRPDDPLLNWNDVGYLYQELRRENEMELAPYLRKLYHVFKLIAHSEMTNKAKVWYAHFARAGINKDVLLLLALNALTDEGHDFRQYLNGFGLLRHLFSLENSEPKDADQYIAVLHSPTARLDEAERERYWAAHAMERPGWLAKDEAERVAT